MRDLEPIAARREIVGLAALEDVLRGPANDRRRSARHGRPGAAPPAGGRGSERRPRGPRPARSMLLADALQMPARPVDAVVLAGIDGDVAVGGPRPGDGGSRPRRSCPGRPPRRGPDPHLDVVDAPVHAVDHQADPLAHLVAGQALVEHPADDLARSLRRAGRTGRSPRSSARPSLATPGAWS